MISHFVLKIYESLQGRFRAVLERLLFLFVDIPLRSNQGGSAHAKGGQGEPVGVRFFVFGPWVKTWDKGGLHCSPQRHSLLYQVGSISLIPKQWLK
jgi:hypothetical protein